MVSNNTKIKIGAAIMSFKSNPSVLSKVVNQVAKLNLLENVELKIIVIIDYGTSKEYLKSIVEKIHNNYKIDIRVLKLKYDPGLQFMRAIAAYYIKKYINDVEFLLYVDNDVFIIPHTFIYAFEVLSSIKNIGAISPLTIYPSGQIQWLANTIDHTCFSLSDAIIPMKKTDNLIITAYPNGAVFIIRLDAFREIGYGSKEFNFWFEDRDIGLRLWKKGYICVAVPNSIAIHIHGLTRRKNIHRIKKYIENRIISRYKCVSANFGIHYLLITIFVSFIDYIRFDLKKMLSKDNIQRYIAAFEFFIMIRSLFKKYALRTKRAKKSVELDRILRYGKKIHFYLYLFPKYGRMLYKTIRNKYVQLSRK